MTCAPLNSQSPRVYIPWYGGLALAIGLTLPTLVDAHGMDYAQVPEGWQPTHQRDMQAPAFARMLARIDAATIGADRQNLATTLDSFAAERELRREGKALQADYHHDLALDSLVEIVRSASEPLIYRRQPSGEFTTPTRGFSETIGREEVALLRVIQPGEGNTFLTQTHNLAHQLETDRYFVLDIAPQGTTHLLLQLEGVAVGRSIHHFAFRMIGEEEPFHWDALFLDGPDKGTLSVTVESGEDLKGWALLRLESQTNGRIIPPSGSIDYQDIMDNISGIHGENITGGYNYHSPGPGQGIFHVAPTRFEMALPPGEYKLTAQRGPEFKVATMTVLVEGNQRSNATIALNRWIDMTQRGWYSGDDHVHAQLLHSHDAVRLMEFARVSDTHVVNLLEMGNERRTYFEQRGFGPAARVQSGNHALVPGMEDPRYMLGHAVGLNMTARIRDMDNYILNDLWADALHQQGGLYGHAHVGHKAFDIIRDMTLLIPRKKSDFSTILQGFLGTDYYFDFLDLGFRHAASAGSDTPYGVGIGSVRVYTFTNKDSLDVDEWFNALGSGRSFVTQGPIVLKTVNDSLPGSVHSVAPDSKVPVKIEVMGHPGHFSPATVQVIKNSRIIATHQIPEGEDAARLVLDIQTGLGGWLVVHVKDVHGAEAMTSPVYFEVEGFRPWNHDRVPTLISERRETLKDILSMLDGIEARHAANQIWDLDYWNRRAFNNITELRARVEIVSEIFDELEQIHLREIDQRVKHHSINGEKP